MYVGPVYMRCKTHSPGTAVCMVSIVYSVMVVGKPTRLLSVDRLCTHRGDIILTHSFNRAVIG